MPPVTRFGTILPDRPSPLSGPDWRQADPRWIARALAATQRKPHGGWFVLDASDRITDQPRRFRVLGQDYVAFRDADGVVVGPDRCPHMGARMSDGHCKDGMVVCPWHALALGRTRRGTWRPLPVHDDGVLVWLRLDETTSEPSRMPYLPERPTGPTLDAVIRMTGACDPEDIVANRLDPWHGVHFHPHSFGTLKVLEQGEDDITVRVAYKVLGKLAVEVDALFHCPDPNSIVMTITAGEGQGSVVETHATPIELEGHSAVIEATIAHSDRPGFAWTARWLSGLIKPMAEKRAARLWVEDLAYAERRRELRAMKHQDAIPVDVQAV